MLRISFLISLGLPDWAQSRRGLGNKIPSDKGIAKRVRAAAEGAKHGHHHY
jgi:hypothetical protein